MRDSIFGILMGGEKTKKSVPPKIHRPPEPEKVLLPSVEILFDDAVLKWTITDMIIIVSGHHIGVASDLGKITIVASVDAYQKTHFKLKASFIYNELTDKAKASAFVEGSVKLWNKAITSLGVIPQKINLIDSRFHLEEYFRINSERTRPQQSTSRLMSIDVEPDVRTDWSPIQGIR